MYTVQYISLYIFNLHMNYNKSVQNYYVGIIQYYQTGKANIADQLENFLYD